MNPRFLCTDPVPQEVLLFVASGLSNCLVPKKKSLGFLHSIASGIALIHKDVCSIIINCYSWGPRTGWEGVELKGNEASKEMNIKKSVKGRLLFGERRPGRPFVWNWMEYFWMELEWSQD